jgi:hypothetical protein
VGKYIQSRMYFVVLKVVMKVMDKNQEINSSDNGGNSRRKFLRLAGISTGMAVTSLSAKAEMVSACSVSGNLSQHGSSVAYDECVTGTVRFDGRSHGFWKSLSGNSASSAFDQYYSPDDPTVAFDTPKDMNDIIKRNVKYFISQAIPSEVEAIFNDFGLTLLSALNNGGGIEYARQMATAYLNAHYEFYDLPDDTSAEQYVINLHQRVMSSANPSSERSQVAQAIIATHVDGKSIWRSEWEIAPSSYNG